MEKLTIEQIKAYSFQVLCELRQICEENGISYSLTGGTLIGAVRHKGFIPWDDDIDIMIPRPDYERLMQILKEKKALPIRVLSDELCGEAYTYAFAKACHPDTVLIEKDKLDSGLKLGVYVDIFPVDGMGMTYKKAKIRTMLFQFLHGLKISSDWTKFHPSKLRGWYYEPFRYACYVLSKLLGRRRIDRWLNRFLRKIPFETAQYAGRLIGDFGSKEIMKKSVFEKTAKVTFEGQQFDAIEDYDTFLTSLYGDYMQLPPVEKQVTHHEFEAYKI